jgi:hypothetical protein
MSTANTHPETECVQCGETYTTGYNAEYCSQECVHRNTGESILNVLKHDHRFCHGCFTKLKEISRPTDEQLRQIEGLHSKESVIGFQYGTEHAETGEQTVKWKTGRKDIIGTGICCGNCGTTDHRDDFQRDFRIQDAAKRLSERITELREEGQFDYTFSAADFVQAWNENTGDWEYAVGVAVE